MNQNLQELLDASERIAVLTGAGISVPSGIPDFRSADGIYSTAFNESVFDLDLFHRDARPFYAFANWFYPLMRAAVPNAAHRAMAGWARAGHRVDVITQNIDDLHERAGSPRVHHVHGRVSAGRCLRCRKAADMAAVDGAVTAGKVACCSGCGASIKPDITFFGEGLPRDAWDASVGAMELADLVVVAGTSLAVQPAAGLPNLRKQVAPLVIINRDATPLDGSADLVLNCDLAAFFEETTDETNDNELSGGCAHGGDNNGC